MAKTPAQRAAKHGNKASGSGPGSGTTPKRDSPASARAAHHGRGRKPSAMYTRALERDPAQRPRSSNMILVAAAGTCVVLYAYQLFLALPDLTTMAGGLSMPDTRLTGYGVDDVESLRQAMSDPARNIYAHFHSTADLIFPLAFALTWLLLIGRLVRRSALRWVLFAVPVLYAAANLAENFAIDRLFEHAPPDDGAVAWASALTITKFALFGLSLCAALAAVVVNAAARRRARRQV